MFTDRCFLSSCWFFYFYTMRKRTLCTSILVLMTMVLIQAQDAPRLIVRGDDIASSHAANLACIQSYQEGIMRSVEIMVPCAWFPEAAQMLRENPGLDVGVHLTFTSEWDNIKWRPLTAAPSITDEQGYFFPMIWPSDSYPPERTLRGADWKLEEIDAEMRAQIELAIREIPQVSHLSCHMGCTSVDESVAKLFQRLAVEYGLDIFTSAHQVERFPGSFRGESYEQRKTNFIAGLEQMKKGQTYLFVEHPALKSMEMEAVGHIGNYRVNAERDMVTRLFTDPEVEKRIEALGIELISYADLPSKNDEK